jgi:2-keto-4-pentenoate hydratase
LITIVVYFGTIDVIEIPPMIEMGHVNLESVAERMLRDYDAGTPGTVFAEGLRLSLDDARQLQDAVANLRQQRGEQVVGYKIGCVSPVNQRRLGVSNPVWGRLWSTEQHSNGARLSKDKFANVAIEGEFAVTLSRNIDPDNVSSATIHESIEQVFPVIELHNLVFHGAAPRGHELIANNAIHAGVVRGRGCAKPNTSAATDLSITFDGKKVDEWKGVRWPNDILQAVGWLTERLAKHGLRLRRGETLLTGALGPPIPVSDVQHVKVTSTQFGTVDASFS